MRCGAAWTRRLKVSVIQRVKPVESPRQGQGGTRALPVQTNRGIPARSARMTAENRGRRRVIVSTVILAKRGSHGQGLGGALSLPVRNHPGDSSVASLPLNDVQELRCVPGCVGERGRGRVALSSVILAKRGSPGQGQGSTLSLPWWNQQGDSRAKRENDSRISEPSPLPSRNHRWDSSVADAPSE